MNTRIILLCAVVIVSIASLTCKKNNSVEEHPESASASITLFDKVLFYDGYAATVSEPVPPNVIRVANARYATRLTDENIARLGGTLRMEITVKAACDNYDRIGNVFVSMMKKGTPYEKNAVAGRIEIARFITPFMDKNKTPDEVPYTFVIDNVARLLTDEGLNGAYDFWIELEIFGVPYAAQTQISGCAGSTKTSYGTLTFVTTKVPEAKAGQELIPIAAFMDFDNYKHTDIIGKTVKSFSITTAAAVRQAKLYLITSNHGSNSGGEEYNRRKHYVYFDGVLLDTYTPGGKSCEPYRKYNTQSNGIYGRNVQSDADWASFSNWCPGDVIPIRVYDLKDVAPGTHTFKIEVPDAKFVAGQGNIPISAYIQGDK